MQPLLLDTCAALWLAADAPMAEEAVQAIASANQDGVAIQISPVTAWEIGLMARKGRFRSSLSPQRWFQRLAGLRFARAHHAVSAGAVGRRGDDARSAAVAQRGQDRLSVLDGAGIFGEFPLHLLEEIVLHGGPEKRDPVPRGDQRAHDVRADEAAPTQDEDRLPAGGAVRGRDHRGYRP